MKIENEFTVGAQVEEAWKALLDLESIAPCLPGAAITEQDGDEYKGTMTVKIGPITAKYKGTVKYEETDEQAHRAVLHATGRDARGQGTASATIVSSMEEVSDGTKVNVETDMKLTGKAAQFGRGIAQDVASKMLGRFAECLEQRLGGESAETPEAPEASAGGASATSSTSGAGASAGATTGASAGATVTPGGAPAGAASGSMGAAQGPNGGASATSGTGAAAASNGSSTSAGGEEAPKSRKIDQPEVEPLDLGEMSQDAIMKRATPVLIGAGVLIVLIWLIRRRRH